MKSFVMILTLLSLTACGVMPSDDAGSVQTMLLSPAPSGTPTPFPTKTPLPETPTPVPLPSFSPTPADIPGCLAPAGDYTILNLDGILLNKRTYDMLTYAKELYGGQLDITGYAITQGSYTNSEAASFGTHDGGGAVDLSVMFTGTYTVAYEEIPPLIRALRTAGFAAWLRDFDELYPGSPIHIHAIAIGDRQLSPAAVEQLTGKYGYFLGYSGVPQENGIPQPDPHGGPLVCRWMIEAGYASPPGAGQDVE